MVILLHDVVSFYIISVGLNVSQTVNYSVVLDMRNGDLVRKPMFFWPVDLEWLSLAHKVWNIQAVLECAVHVMVNKLVVLQVL